MAVAAVKVERGKLIELLTERKEQAVVTWKEQNKKAQEEFEASLAEVIEAAKRRLTEAENLNVLSTAISKHRRSQESVRYRERQSVDYVEAQFDSALRLIEISTDEEFRVTSASEFGRLLGL